MNTIGPTDTEKVALELMRGNPTLDWEVAYEFAVQIEACKDDVTCISLIRAALEG